MNIKHVILLFLLLLFVKNSAADVLSSASKLISFYDHVHITSQEIGLPKFNEFTKAAERAGLDNIIGAVRMQRAVLLSKKQSVSVDPKIIYFRDLRKLAAAGVEDSGVAAAYQLFDMAMQHNPLTNEGGAVDIKLRQLKASDRLEEELENDLLKVLEILSENSEFIRFCSDLGLAEEAQILKEELKSLSNT